MHDSFPKSSCCQVQPTSWRSAVPERLFVCACLCAWQVLMTYRGQTLGLMEVESRWLPNKARETKLCYGTASLEHPGTQMVAMERGK